MYGGVVRLGAEAGLRWESGIGGMVSGWWWVWRLDGLISRDGLCEEDWVFVWFDRMVNILIC